MVETLIMVLGVIAGFSLLKVKEHRRIAVVNLNNKVQLIAVALIIFIMGINLGSMEDFAHKMLTMGLQSLVFCYNSYSIFRNYSIHFLANYLL